jgi:hypothetical protein
MPCLEDLNYNIDKSCHHIVYLLNLLSKFPLSPDLHEMELESLMVFNFLFSHHRM